jgi:hypothetical protein
MVTAWAVPDWGLSGATTTTFPKGRRISIKALIPGAFKLSSFVTRISGFSIEG